jgi:hypothetical protein
MSMNIVQIILELLSGNVMSKLSSLIGENEAKTKSAVGAAVPALLSGLSNLASNEQGAQKLASALGKLDMGSINNLSSMLSGGSAENLAEHGGSLLTSLLGGNTVSGVTNALAGYAGLGGGVSKSLLSYLAPLVLGGIAKQFAGKAINAQGLMNLFSSQKANIANAIPSGLSLADVPGLETARSTAKAAYGSTKEAVASPATSVLPWLLGLAALALLLYFFWQRTSTALPDATELTKDVTGTFSSLTNTLTGIKDVASAEAAIPALAQLGNKTDDMRALMDQLPAAAKTTITTLIKSSLGKLGDQISTVLMIPGVGEKLRPALEQVVGKLTNLGGLTPAEFALPSPQVTDFGSRLSAILASLTESLTGVKDAASADAALPRLQELNQQLGTTMGEWNTLPSAGRATIGSVMKSPLASLTQLVTRVLAIAGVGERIKPIADEIVRKLTAIGG